MTSATQEECVRLASMMVVVSPGFAKQASGAGCPKAEVAGASVSTWSLVHPACGTDPVYDLDLQYVNHT
jgi:hypothetical protein